MIIKNAIRYRPYNSGGPGGQHQNRSENAIEARLEDEAADQLGIPRGITASASMRSQRASKRSAQRILRAKIHRALQEKSAKARFAAGRERVRTYNAAENRVVDGSGFQASYARTVGRGDLSTLIERRRERQAGGDP